MTESKKGVSRRALLNGQQRKLRDPDASFRIQRNFVLHVCDRDTAKSVGLLIVNRYAPQHCSLNHDSIRREAHRGQAAIRPASV